MKKTLFITLFFCLTNSYAADLLDHQTEKPIAKQHTNIQVLNFWATYCIPCRKEMPELNRWHQSIKKQPKLNVQLVGIAIDNKENINEFLKTTPVSYPIWRYVGKNSRAFMRDYGNTIGVLPYTIMRAPQCGIQQTITGEVDSQKLNQTLATIRAKCRQS